MTPGASLLQALELGDINQIKHQLALYAETEQRVSLQVQAREALYRLLESGLDKRTVEKIRSLVCVTRCDAPDKDANEARACRGRTLEQETNLVQKEHKEIVEMDAGCKKLIAEALAQSQKATKALHDGDFDAAQAAISATADSLQVVLLKDFDAATSSDPSKNKYLVSRARMRMFGEIACRELYVQIVTDAASESDALRQIVKPLGLTVETGDRVVYDDDQWCYQVPPHTDLWYKLSDL